MRRKTIPSNNLCFFYFLVGEKCSATWDILLWQLSSVEIVFSWFSNPSFRSVWKGIVGFDPGTWEMARKAHCFTNSLSSDVLPVTLRTWDSFWSIRPVHSLSTQGTDKWVYMLFLGLWKMPRWAPANVRRGLHQRCLSLWQQRVPGAGSFTGALESLWHVLHYGHISLQDMFHILHVDPPLPLCCWPLRHFPQTVSSSMCCLSVLSLMPGSVFSVAAQCPDRMAGSQALPLEGNRRHCLCSSEVKLLQAGKQIQQIWNPINDCIFK